MDDWSGEGWFVDGLVVAALVFRVWWSAGWNPGVGSHPALGLLPDWLIICRQNVCQEDSLTFYNTSTTSMAQKLELKLSATSDIMELNVFVIPYTSAR